MSNVPIHYSHREYNKHVTKKKDKVEKKQTMLGKVYISGFPVLLRVHFQKKKKKERKGIKKTSWERNILMSIYYCCLICLLSTVSDLLAIRHSKEKHQSIYIYIYCHPPTEWFDVSQLFSVAIHAGCFKLDRNTPNFMLHLVSHRSATRWPRSAREL